VQVVPCSGAAADEPVAQTTFLQQEPSPTEPCLVGDHECSGLAVTVQAARCVSRWAGQCPDARAEVGRGPFLERRHLRQVHAVNVALAAESGADAVLARDL